jgi:hypothetical protein
MSAKKKERQIKKGEGKNPPLSSSLREAENFEL